MFDGMAWVPVWRAHTVIRVSKWLGVAKRLVSIRPSALLHFLNEMSDSLRSNYHFLPPTLYSVWIKHRWVTRSPITSGTWASRDYAWRLDATRICQRFHIAQHGKLGLYTLSYINSHWHSFSTVTFVSRSKLKSHSTVTSELWFIYSPSLSNPTSTATTTLPSIKSSDFKFDTSKTGHDLVMTGSWL